MKCSGQVNSHISTDASLSNMRFGCVVVLLASASTVVILAAQYGEALSSCMEPNGENSKFVTRSPNVVNYLFVQLKKSLRTRLVPRYYSIATCTDKKHYANLTSYKIAIDANGGDYIADAEWWLYRAVRTFSKMAIVIHRCSGGVTANLCEYFATWAFDKALCGLMVSKNVLWSPIVQSMEPEIRCPLLAGFRTCHNGTLDFSIAEVIGARSGIDKYIWQAEIQIFDERPELAICFNITVEPRRVRVKF